MIRTERASEAARLQAEGLNGIQIAERMGIGRSYAYELLTDPDGVRAKERKQRYGRPCIEGCGRITDGSNGRDGAPLRCKTCTETRNNERNARIIAAWDSGLKEADVAAVTGVDENTVRAVIQYARQKGEPVTLHRRRDRELWPLIEKRLGEGATQSEIAAEVGSYTSNINQMVLKMREAGIAVPDSKRREHNVPNYSAQTAIDKDIERTEERIAALQTELAERQAYMEALKAAREAMASKLPLRSVA